MKIAKFFISLSLIISCINSVQAQQNNEVPHKLQENPIAALKAIKYRPHGFLDLNTYYDTAREQETITLNAFLDLPGNFGYFSLQNFETIRHEGDAFDIESYITEQNLFWNYKGGPFGLKTQYFSASGDDNENLKFGLDFVLSKTPYLKRFLKKINMSYTVDLFPIVIDDLGGYSAQIQHVYKMQVLPSILKDRVYIGGFLDHNMNFDDTNQLGNIISETQIGIRLVNQLYAVTELRWNNFIPEGDKFGLGIGLEYKLNF